MVQSRLKQSLDTLHYLSIDRFHSRGQQLCLFLGIKESFTLEKSSLQLPQELFLFTNMAGVTSYENDL